MATKAVDKLAYSLDDTLVGNLSDAVVLASTTIGDIQLNGKGLHSEVSERILNGTLARTTSGASTLTLVFSDMDGVIRNLDAMQAEGTVILDGTTFVFVAGSVSGSQFTATFEDDIVHRLMKNKTPRKYERGQFTRAQAIAALARDERVPFICPEAGIVQHVGTPPTKKISLTHRTPGFARGSGTIKVKGNTATAYQRKIISEVLGVGQGRHLSTDALVAAIMTITQESDAGKEQDHGGASRSWGVFSQTPSAGWGTVAQVTNIVYASNKFYNTYLASKKSHPKYTLGELCDNVQGPKTHGLYDQWQNEAQATVAAFNGGTISTSNTGTATYEFDAGVQTRGESHWAAMQRLASEVNWLLWSDQGALYFMSYTYVFSSQAVFSISRGDDEIISVGWNCDTGQKSQSATVDCFMTRWSAPPGTLIQLNEEGLGSGRWMVETITTNMTNMQGSADLKRFEAAVLEPLATNNVSSASQYKIPTSVPPAIAKVYAAARDMATKKYSYQWGGGHNNSFAPSVGVPGGPSYGHSPGYDCSGSVSAVLHAGGLIGSPEASGGLETWGTAGQGYYMTVWANGGHVWIEFNHINGDECFSTSSIGNHGPQFQSYMHSKSGFIPRHLKGA